MLKPKFLMINFILNQNFNFVQDTVGQLSLSNLATWHESMSVEKMVPEASDVGCSAIPVSFYFFIDDILISGKFQFAHLLL